LNSVVKDERSRNPGGFRHIVDGGDYFTEVGALGKIEGAGAGGAGEGEALISAEGGLVGGINVGSRYPAMGFKYGFGGLAGAIGIGSDFLTSGIWLCNQFVA